MKSGSMEDIIKKLTEDESFKKDFLENAVKTVGDMYPGISEEEVHSLLRLTDKEYKQLLEVDGITEEKVNKNGDLGCVIVTCAPSSGYEAK